MRHLALLLSFVLLLQFNLLTTATFGDAVTVTTVTSSTAGGITGQVPVSKVGALIASDALAILSGTEIKIETKSRSKSSNNTTTPPNNLLTGILLQTKVVGGAATGYAVFNGGDRFSRINARNCPDRVTTVAGATYTGTITQVTAAILSIDTASGAQTIACPDIASIHSARAFKYNIQNYGNPDAKMYCTTTCEHSVAASNNYKKLVIVALAITVVAVAIAVPIALAASHHHHSNQNSTVYANILASRQPAVPTPTLPMGMKTPTFLICRDCKSLAQPPVVVKGPGACLAQAVLAVLAAV